MKTIIKKIVLIQLFVLLAHQGNSQGFVNLNFESANLTGYPQTSPVPATNAFPSWTANAPYIIYDDISLSGNSISIIDTNSPYFTTAIQGKYYALLISGNTPINAQTISLGQTGAVPSWAQSITFWGAIGGMQITFAGHLLNFAITGNNPNYNIYTADISSYAGQTGELLFTLPPYVASATLDNIQFSSTAVPEPSTLALLGLGGALLMIRRWQKPA